VWVVDVPRAARALADDAVAFAGAIPAGCRDAGAGDRFDKRGGRAPLAFGAFLAGLLISELSGHRTLSEVFRCARYSRSCSLWRSACPSIPELRR
jgi:hypothetical protein